MFYMYLSMADLVFLPIPRAAGGWQGNACGWTVANGGREAVTYGKMSIMETCPLCKRRDRLYRKLILTGGLRI